MNNKTIFLLRGLLFLAGGIFLMLSSESLTDLFLQVIGLLILLSGWMRAWAAWPNRSLPQGKMALWRSLSDALIGLSLLLFPKWLSSFLSIILALWLLFNAISTFSMAFRWRRAAQAAWRAKMTTALLMTFLALLLLSHPDFILSSITFFIGLAMALFGALSTWQWYRAEKNGWG